MSGDTLLFESLSEFYQDPYYSQRVHEILSGEIAISLRSIDWFITNYSKKNNIYYQLYKDTEDNPSLAQDGDFHANINVHQSYKAQLKSYSKKTFDPFCRRQRILVTIGDQEVDTTIGQLNFFRWALQNGVIDYILSQKKDIEEDMNECLKKLKVPSDQKKHGRKKREELSLSATRGLSKTNVGIELVFD
jgi:exoribonuclease R